MGLSKLLYTLDGCRKGFYVELTLLRDPYMMKSWRHDFFDAVIDIGANVGIFTLCACMRHFGAKVFAYEPCRETFDYLIKNNNFLTNVAFINEALGDGSALHFRPHKSFGSNQFYRAGEIDEKLNSYTVKSLPLYKMFEKNKIDKKSNYFIKIDAEGGERFLLGDERSTEIIKTSAGTAIELHFPGIGSEGKGDFRAFPKWHEYNSWINKNFSKTHDIVYHFSSKRAGYGTYVLLNKNKSGRI